VPTTVSISRRASTSPIDADRGTLEGLDPVRKLFDHDLSIVQIRAATVDRAEHRVALGLVDHAYLPVAVGQKANRDGIVRVVVHIVQTAADRVDDPHRVGADRHLLVVRAFFGQNGVVRVARPNRRQNGILHLERLGDERVAATFPGKVLVGCVDFRARNRSAGASRRLGDLHHAI
jgi:hypothetical protein